MLNIKDDVINRLDKNIEIKHIENGIIPSIKINNSSIFMLTYLFITTVIRSLSLKSLIDITSELGKYFFASSIIFSLERYPCSKARIFGVLRTLCALLNIIS